VGTLPALHLDTQEGQVWLQLEWRALAAALIEAGPDQTVAIRDALAFRAYRHKRFPNSARVEASQEIAEGVPEYTGVIAGEPDMYAARWRAAAKLIQRFMILTARISKGRVGQSIWPLDGRLFRDPGPAATCFGIDPVRLMTDVGRQMACTAG